MYTVEKASFRLSARLLMTVSLSVMFLHAIAQKNVNTEKANALKQTFKDARQAAYSYRSQYGFKIVNGKLQAQCDEELGMISLEGDVDYKHYVFYNDNITIESAEGRYANGKVITTPKVCGNYEIENTFYSDAKVCVYRFNFLYPGTEIVFKSRTTYNDPKYLTKIFFHDELPVEKRNISIAVPASVNVELIEKNFDGFNIKKTVTQEGTTKVYTYTVEKLNAFKSESNSLGRLYNDPHIIVATKDYSTEDGSKKVIASVDDLYGWYFSLVKQVQNDQTPFSEEVKRLTATSKTSEEKIRSIYYWVQDNIKYIAFEDGIAGFRPEAAQKVYTNRYGDCKGMANLTKEMLKAAGFDARLTWIGTNRIPYTHDLPSLAVDNHMICTVTHDGKQYVLDPTEKYIALGKYGERIQGKEMLIENGEKYIVRKVPVETSEQNKVLQEESITLEGELLKGQGQITFNGEAKKNLLYYSNYIKQEDKKKLFDRVAVSEYSNRDEVNVTNVPVIDRDQVMEVKYTFGLNNKVTSFDNDLYIDLDWNKTFKNLTMEDDRMSDYYFERKINTRTVKKLKVPAGYKVSHLPSNLSKKHDDFSITVNFEQRGGELFYTNEIIVSHGLIRKADFKTWNAFIKELNDVYNDQIVLTKLK
jgi:transglutaminase-like putative cysteine protease